MDDGQKRQGFTFWRSFRDAIAAMPEDAQLPVYRAIADYALDGAEPADLSQFGKVVWTAILPTLQLGRTRAEAGANGGRNGRGTTRNAGNRNAGNKSKSIANQKQINSTETETLTETETETGKATGASAPDFAAFWAAYPKKVGKQAAVKAFTRLARDRALTPESLPGILAALDRQKRSRDWQKDGGQFIPHPATWLNGRRWEDEEGTAAARPAVHSPVALRFEEDDL